MSTTDDVDVTNYHLNAAERHGQKIAASHKDKGIEPLTDEELWVEHPQEDIVFLITGAKIHEVPENYLILDSFEEGYFYWEGWDDAV